jgi:hypothetical protein
MAVNLDVLLQSPIFDFWAVPVTFMPYASQPSGANYQGRGILNRYSADVQALDGSMYSDQRTILDIRESEFPTMPIQKDHVFIPVDCNNVPKGEYVIVDLVSNGGGQTMLTLKEFETIMGRVSHEHH